MKKLLLTIITFNLLGLSTFSQAPQGFNYQALARDSQGAVISNEDISLSVSIVMGEADGVIVYTEVHELTTSPNGLFNAIIGTGIPESTDFSEIQWGTATFYLQVSLAAEVTNNELLLVGTQQLMSVPYALFANESANSNIPQTCPEGFEAVNDKYCIQTEQQTATNWFAANVQCAEINAELCSWSQWYYACQKSSLSLSEISDNWEWINDGGDDKSNHAKAVGLGSCTADNSFNAEASINAVRCCFSR